MPGSVGDVRSSELLELFEKAHAKAVAREKATGLDKHHAAALRKAKRSVEESLRRGDNLTLSSLHSLKHVGSAPQGDGAMYWMWVWRV